MESFNYPTAYNAAQSSRRRNSHTTPYPLDGLNQQEYTGPWDGSPFISVTTGYGMSSTTPTTNGISVTAIPLPSTTGGFLPTFAPYGIRFMT
jgi:hypothetical protein